MNTQIQEAMIILQEECAEVIQAISKCFRFGLNNSKLGHTQTNAQHLEEEIGDLIALVAILVEQGVVDASAIELAKVQKTQKLKKWSTLFK
jgi:NTP pyrophosphatase (non-canonical NTP hydrolase)